MPEQDRTCRRTTLCIVQPKIGVLTETFIDTHFRYLKPPSFRLECDPYPSHTEDGRPLFSIAHPIVHRSAGRLAGLEPQEADRALFRRLPSRIKNLVFARYLRRRSVGVVLAEYGPTGVAIRQACTAAGVPMVVHFHGYDAYIHDVLAEHRTTYPLLFADAAAVIAVSKHMRSQLISLGAPPEKVVYNPYGIDVTKFHGARPELNEKTFLAVGRFVEKKAPDLTIRAFAGVVENHPDARLVMVGDGPLFNKCTEMISSLGLQETVDLVGPQPHDEVARLMTSARCLVQHSITPQNGDREGTPLAILEAMASGLPVIATRHGGIIDVVSEERTGFLVDEGDFKEMRVSMSRIAGSGDLAATLGRAGREVLVREHSLSDRIAALDEILLQAAGHGHPISAESGPRQ